MSDCLIEMLLQVRGQLPAVYQSDEWHAWLCAIGDCISALPTRDQRWAASVLVANDLTMSMPGLPLSLAHITILNAVILANGMERP